MNPPTEKDPNLCGTGHGTDVGYRVQVRCDKTCHSNPTELADGIVSTEWRDVSFRLGKNPAGIPQSIFDRKCEHGLLTYEGAVALAWTILAQNEHRDLECRLVAYNLETTFKLTRQGVVEGLEIKSRWNRQLTLKA